MFNSLRTSLENKQRITELTNKLALGAENVIARIALGYSLSKDTSLDLKLCSTDLMTIRCTIIVKRVNS